ncbi:MAG: fused MFS/spermidine synthase [Actinomycetales bacterium]|nr:fused MFS/spermidine synthase [Actinomycetales bacterium]
MSQDLYVLDMDGMQQSAGDVNDPTNLVFDYMRRIADVIDAMPEGRLRVLHVGGAAMTLPRYVAATRPRSAQVVLEPCVELIEQVRAEAPLPARSGIKVRPVTGQEGILALRDESWDVVILDAFDGGLVPTDLTSQSFVEQVRRVLSPGGIFIANLVDKPPFQAVRDFVAVSRDLGSPLVGMEPATYKGKRSGNVIVVCGSVPPRPLGEPSPLEYRTWMGQALASSFGGGKPHK